MGGLRLCVAVFGLFLMGPAATWAQHQDPATELRRLAEAINKTRAEVRYEAEQTVYAFTPTRVTTSRFRVFYSYPYRKRVSIGGPEESRLVMLEDGEYLWSYFPAKKLVVKEPLRVEDSPFPLCSVSVEDLERLERNYRVLIRGPVSVPAGGLQCRIVELIPNSNDRPWREWWLENRWYVPIRVRVSTSDGIPTYMAELRKIRWQPALDAGAFRLKVPQDTRVYEVQEKENLTMEQARSLFKDTLLLPQRIPKGYVPRSIVHRVEGTRHCLQILYSDGLSSFSFFQEWVGPGNGPSSRIGLKIPSLSPAAGPLIRQYGMINVVTVRSSGLRTVIVGDIAKDRLLEIAESLHGQPPLP